MGNFGSNETWLIWLYVGKNPASHAGERPAALELPILVTVRNKSADSREDMELLNTNSLINQHAVPGLES